MRLTGLRVAVVVVAVLAMGGPAQASPEHERPVSLAGKKVLLVNDDSVQAAKPDGSDGLGLYVLRQRLCQAGADVVVVGPWASQGGKSRGVSGAAAVSVAAPLAVPAGFGGDCAGAPAHGVVLGVCQGGGPCAPDSLSVTPADAVDLALDVLVAQRFGWADGPDVVLAGINAGPNTDLAVNGSATIGAATASVERDVPALAVNAGTHNGQRPGIATYVAAADVVVRLLGSPHVWSVLRDMVLLNVNQPDVQPGGRPAPVRWTSVGQKTEGRAGYTPTGDNSYSFAYTPETSTFDRDSDTRALLDGYVSVSAVVVDRTYTGR